MIQYLIFNGSILPYLGILFVLGSILAGFIFEGGNLLVLFQPFTALIVTGSAFGILVLSNPKSLLKSMWLAIKKLKKEGPYTSEEYVLLLTFMFYFFKQVKLKGVMSLENDIENPYESDIFQDFPIILKNEEVLTFFCDYMRMFVLGFDKSFELENLMQEQINIRRNYMHEITQALFKLADALPALGIVAAVLGVINAMASINAEPVILGHKIGAALIGTFMGVAISYCFIAPLGSFMDKFNNDESKFLECIKAGFVSFVSGNPVSIAIEFARQTIPADLKPGFLELEKTIDAYKNNKRTRKNARIIRPAVKR